MLSINYDKSFIKKSWSKKREQIVNEWIKILEYNQLIIYFYLFQLKRIESAWAWTIIVLSSLVSTISLILFNKDKLDNIIIIIINVIITAFTLFITLIAAWMKKQNYVERISESEKYLQSLTSLLAELTGQIKIIKDDRMEYSMFLEKYKDKVINFDASMPLISPDEWKKTNYIVTKYYPEIIEDVYPWNEKSDFGRLILATYHKVKYRTLLKRICSDYYCYSNCCVSEDKYSRKSLKEYFKNREYSSKNKENIKINIEDNETINSEEEDNCNSEEEDTGNSEEEDTCNSEESHNTKTNNSLKKTTFV
jgi:hypothetical protein